MLYSFGYADDILLFWGNKASLESMVADCSGAFGQAGLEVGLDKTHWSSSIEVKCHTLVGKTPSGIGSVIEPGAHSGSAVRHRTKKASSVFCKWKPLPWNPMIRSASVSRPIR